MKKWKENVLSKEKSRFENSEVWHIQGLTGPILLKCTVRWRMVSDEAGELGRGQVIEGLFTSVSGFGLDP